MKNLVKNISRILKNWRIGLMILAGVCAGGGNVWGVNYTWTGSAGDSSWENPENWAPNDGTNYPGTDPSDEVIIQSNHSDLSITIPSGTDITITKFTLTSAFLFAGYNVDIILNSKLTVTGEMIIGSGSTAGKVNFTKGASGTGEVQVTKIITSTTASAVQSKIAVNEDVTLTVHDWDASSGATQVKGAGTINLTGNKTGDQELSFEEFSGTATGDNIANLMAIPSYEWAGTESNDWSNIQNWTYGYVPTTTSDITFASTVTNYPTISTNTTIKSLTMSAAANASLTVSPGSKLTITDSAKIAGTISGEITGPSAANITTDGQIILNDATIHGNINSSEKIKTTKNLTLDGTINNTILFSGTNDQTFSYKENEEYSIEVEKTAGKITFENSGNELKITNFTTADTSVFDLNFTENTTITNPVIFHQSGSFNIATGKTLVFNGEVADNFTFIGGTIQLNGNLEVGGNWDNQGSFDANSKTVTFTGSPTITGSNTFATLEATTPGSTLNFTAGTTTTASTIILTDVTLTSDGEWTLDAPAASSTINAVTIKNSKSINKLTAANSSIDLGGNINWNFEGQTYIWTGTSSTSWNTASNWTPESVPGNGTIITIPVSCPNYPVLTEPTTIGTGTLTVAANASLDLGGFTFTCKSVTLNGTLKIKQNEIFSTTDTNTFGTNYILDYYNAGKFDDTARNFFPTPNIVVEAGKTLSVTTTSAPTFNSLNNSGTVTLSADLSVTSLEQASGAEINAGANNLSITSVTSDAGKITLAGGTIKNTTAAITLNQIDLSSESTIDGGTQGITISTGFTTGLLIANNKLNIKGTLTKLTANSSNVTLSDDLSTGDFTQDSDSTINVGTHTFTISGTVSDEGKIAVSSGTLHNSGSSSITIKNLDLTGSNAGSPATINGGTGLVITSIPNWGHILSQGSVSLGGSLNTLKVDSASDSVTLTANTTIGTLTNNGKVDGAYSLTLTNAVFCSPVGYTTPLTSLSVSGTTDINSGATSITTTGTQTYTGAVTLAENTALQASTVTFSNTVDGAKTLSISGDASFNDQVGSLTALTSLSVSGTTAINSGATSINTTDTQAYTGAVTLGENTALQASTVTFSNTVDGAKTLAISGDASFNAHVGSSTALSSISVSGTTSLTTGATSITTTGTQTYTGQLTTAATTALTATDTSAEIQTAVISTTGNLTLTASKITSAGAIAPTTNNTDTLAFESSNVSYSSIGTTSNKYALVKIGLTGSSLELAGDAASTNTENIHSTRLQLIGSSLTTSNITFGDELIYDTTGAISLNTISASKITLPNTASSINFINTIKQTSGDFTIDYPATLTGDTTFQITNGKFILDDTATTTPTGSINPSDSSYKLTISALNGIELNNDIAETTKLAQLTIQNNLIISKNLTLNSSKVNIPSGSTVTLSPTASAHTLTITDNLFNAGTFTSNDNIITKSLTNEGSFTANADICLSGDFKDTGTWNSNAHKDIILNSSTVDQSFSPKAGTEYYSITVDKKDASSAPAKNVIFNENSLTVTNLTLTNVQDVTFNKQTEISTFSITKAKNITFNDTSTITSYSDTTDITSINFVGDSIFKSDITFNTPSVIFSGNHNISFKNGTTDKKLTHTGGTFSLNGTLTASTINLNKTTVTGTITSSNSITTSSTTTLSGNATYNATNSITFNDTILEEGTPSPTANTLNLNAQNITCNKNITVKELNFTSNNGTIKIDNAAAVTVNTLAFATSGSTASIELNGTIDAKTTLTFPFNTKITGESTIKCPNAVFPTNITLNIDSYQLTIDAYTLFNGTLSGTSTLTITNDLVFYEAAATDTITLNTPITCNGSIVLYGGELQVKSNLTANKDLLLYGTAYKEKDEVSGIEGIYKYNDSYRETLHPQISFQKTTLPDGNPLPANSTDMRGKLSTTGGVTIKALKNFYANGITATGTTEWNLSLPANKNTVTNFAEAFYCNFTSSKCKVTCHTSGADSDALSIAAESCSVNSSYKNGWDLENFEIVEAYTVHDNLIRIKFNHQPRTADNELKYYISRAEYQTSSSSKGSYHAALTTNGFDNFDNHVVKPTDLISIEDGTYTLYFCTQNNQTAAIGTGSWNCDANGTTPGNTGSSDTHGAPHNNGTQQAVPYLNIPRNSGTFSYFITDAYGKRLLHYYSTSPDLSTPSSVNNATYTDIEDKTDPVIVAVKTGQELHDIYDSAIGETSQHSYDSHNFIEFIYSESVNFGSTDTSKCDLYIPAFNAIGDVNVVENIQVTEKLGALTGDITTEGTLTFAGIGTIANGKIHTGKNGVTDAKVNTFYRDNPHSIKISIAGLTSGTVQDRDGNHYKNWVGYIESAVVPSGEYHIGSLVFDQAGNPIKEPSTPVSVINDGTSGLYSSWDISEPVFAPCRLSVTTTWGDKTQSEVVGSSAGSTLDRIEFHLFDNTPDYTSSDSAFWFTQKGWCEAENSTNLKDPAFTYCADIIGGARPFTEVSSRTTGGIRFSTKVQNYTSFKYSTARTTNPTSSFENSINGVYATTTSTVFTGPSSPRRSNSDPDGLYFGLGLTEANLPLQTTFTISYTDTTGYMTDLAGNRLRSDRIYSIDRTPPSIDLCLTQLNTNELTVIFVKELTVKSSDIKYVDQTTGATTQITQSYEQIIPYCFEIFELDSGNTIISTDLQIDTLKPAKVEIRHPAKDSVSKSSFTFITLKLNRTVTLKDIQNLYIRVRYAPQYAEYSRDPITSINGSRVTFIQDTIGNYIQMYSAHSISDFVIGGVTPLYAYDDNMTYNTETIMDGLYEEGSWAVHDWDEDQQNYGRLPANHPISIVAAIDDGTTAKANLPQNVRIFLANEPDAASVSTQFNADFNKKSRIWLPEVINGLFPGLANSNNTKYLQIDSTQFTKTLADGLIFKLPESITTTWKNNDQVSFLFGLLNPDKSPVRIYNVPFFDVTTEKYDLSRSTAVPLYVLRLKEPTDIVSLDLWSFKIHQITEQRAGVSVLNNVINSDKGEKTVVKVNMPSDGKLSIMVMTLDGNIVQYLTHGDATAGEHYYTWNGKNQNGKAVARGMYFVRIVGNGIDETRKVMVVK